VSSQDEPELDVDAAFAEIVARWGPTGDEPAQQEPVQPTEEPPAAAASRSLHDLFRPALPDPPADPSPDPSAEVAWDDEGHFVPPPPPPLPAVEPRRRLAWLALAGAPVVGMLFLLVQVAMPSWVSLGLVLAFVGGFGYLVATMGSGDRSGDGWSGDDGARL
jgi:hypothetical protein